MNVPSLLNTIPSIIGAVSLPVLYCWAFWRVARRSVGNKLMESACISGGLFMACFITMKIPDCPVWITAFVGLLGLLVGFAMIFFIFKGAFLAVRGKLRSRRV